MTLPQARKWKEAGIVDLSFIVTCAHQKIKALFCHIIFDYYNKFCKKMFFSLSLFLLGIYINIKKEEYRLNSIVLQNFSVNLMVL